MATPSRLMSMLGPLRLIWLSVKFHISTLKDAFLSTGPTALLHLKQIHAAAVANMLITASPGFIAYESANTPVQSLVSSAAGKILDLGPGPGNQMQRFDASLVEVVYGVEPSPHYAANLAAKISQFGLEGKYTLLNCGIEDVDVLERSGIVEGSMDTVLSIQVLCSVRDVKGVVRECWKLLKPGGKFVFWEHVRSKDNVTGVVQACWNPAWSALVGCCINRDILADILAAGEWENPGEIVVEDDKLTCLPRVWGVLRKKA